MSTQAHYVGAWGFSIKLYRLWKAAFAWRSLQLFRLVRLRQQNTLQTSNQTSLASLPVEILDMIEAEVLKQGLETALWEMPRGDCTCDLSADLREIPDVQSEFEDFCDTISEELSYKEKWSAFEETQDYQEWYEGYYDEHYGDCDTRIEGREFWKDLYASCAYGSMDGNAVMLHTFLVDHHMELPRFKLPMHGYYDELFFDDFYDDPFSDPEDEPVLVIIHATRCWYATRPKPIIPGPFVVNKPKLFSKLRMYGILPQGIEKKDGKVTKIPLKWSSRRYKGEPVDLSGSAITAKQENDESADEEKKVDGDQAAATSRSASS